MPCSWRRPAPIRSFAGDGTFEPFNMIFQTAEDGLGDTVKPRLLSAEANLDRVLVIDDAEKSADSSR